MVEVHLHLVGANLKHTSVEAVAVLVLQRHDGTLEDVLVVKVSVDLEDAAVKVEHSFLFEVTVSLFLAELELEVGAFVELCYLLFKLVECDAEAGDELEGLACRCLFNLFFLLTIDGVECVAHGHEHVVLIFHSVFLLFYCL